MNREHAAKIWPFVKAFGEGRQVTWKNQPVSQKPSYTFENNPSDYKILPEPKLRPWKPEEVPVGASYKHKGTGTIYNPIQQDEIGIWFTGNADGCRPLNIKYKWEDFLKFYEHSLDHGKTWLPCGVME